MISVIIPVYNGAIYLPDAIQSVLDQTLPAGEILIIDDGSTDGSAAVIDRFSSTVRCIHQDHQGAAVARNRGVAESSGNYLAFLDADDIWLARKLEYQFNLIEHNPSQDIVLGMVEQFVSPEVPEEERARFVHTEMTMEGYIAGAMLVKRASFDRVGPFDFQWRIGEVIDWFARAKEIGLKITILPMIVMKRRIHLSNMMRRATPSFEDYARLLKKSLDRRRSISDSRNASS